MYGLWSRDRSISWKGEILDIKGSTQRVLSCSHNLAELNPKCYMNYSVIFTEIRNFKSQPELKSGSLQYHPSALTTKLRANTINKLHTKVTNDDIVYPKHGILHMNCF